MRPLTLTRGYPSLGRPFDLLHVLVFAAAALLAIAGASDIRANPLPVASQEGAFVEPAQMGTGALVLRIKEPGKFIEAPRLKSDVTITVTGPVARARITQRFENPSDLWVEGVYVFPLPQGAAVDTLRMQVGDRFPEGEIKERGQGCRPCRS